MWSLKSGCLINGGKKTRGKVNKGRSFGGTRFMDMISFSLL
jgi:hypothetical protein